MQYKIYVQNKLYKTVESEEGCSLVSVRNDLMKDIADNKFSVDSNKDLGLEIKAITE